MSAMGELDAELQMHWMPANHGEAGGYRHAGLPYLIFWWNSNHATVTLYREDAAGVLDLVLDGELHTAVHHVMVSA